MYIVSVNPQVSLVLFAAGIDQGVGFELDLNDTKQLTSQTLGQTADEITEKNVGQTAEQITEQTSGQPAEQTKEQTTEQTSEQINIKPGWIKKNGLYYYRNSDGTTLQKRGIVKIDGYKYFLGSDGRRLSGLNKSGGKWYYFKSKNGRMVEKAGWKKIKGKKYYIKKGGALATGIRKIGKKTYGFTDKGVLRGFSKPFKYKGKWYRTDKLGQAKKLSSMQVKCSNLTRKYIDKYTSSKMSDKKKLNVLFNKLIAGNYVPEYIKRDEVDAKDFPYSVTYKVLANNGKYNCYGFACTIASIAKELGYEPYVIVMDYDHAVVEIDGKYYDNMGARFGAKEPTLKNYKVYKKVKF